MGKLQRVSRPFQARRALLRSLAPRYQQALWSRKRCCWMPLWNGREYSRKYAIEWLAHGKQDQQTIQRRRLPQYGPTAQQASSQLREVSVRSTKRRASWSMAFSFENWTALGCTSSRL